MSENNWNVITDSLGLLHDAAMLISDANAGAPTPCSAWTVAQVFQHAVGDQLAWAAAIGVGTGRPRTPSRRPVTLRAPLTSSSSRRSRPPGPRGRGSGPMTTRCRPPFRRAPCRPPTAAAACALDAAVHAWDIAVALGQPGNLSDGLAAQLLPAARSIVEPLRQFGAYAAARPASAEDGHAAELLRYLGRDPRWGQGR